MKLDASVGATPTIDRRSFLSLGALVTGAVAMGASVDAVAASATPGETVDTTYGRIRGTRHGRVLAFKGVPYGASTAGSGRFMPPKKPQPWSGVRDATKLGQRAPQQQAQLVAEFGIMDRTEPSGEECLVLNVWTAGLNDGAKRPVMVWLHGGGFSGGSAGFTVYDGTNMADKHDVVFVGVNHRLNVFGFLYLADLGGERWSQASNVGMLDIVAALEWVRDNIERFGGDPHNVTVLGQSGGGSKVSTLLGMPAAKGLFHRAIAMSGSQVRSLTTEQATRTAEAVLSHMKIRPDQLERLQQLPFYVLRDALDRGAGPGSNLNFAPVMDGRTIPAHIFDPVATSLSADVPLLIGSTETEITWRTQQHYDELDDAALRHYVKQVLRTDDATVNKVIALYRANRPRASNLDLYLILASDVTNWRIGTGLQADRKAAQAKAPVYKYYFQWYSPVRGGMLRSMHTMDIPFALDNVEAARVLLGPGRELQAFADKMAGAWVAFARTGNPNHPGIPHWPAFTTSQRATMILDHECKVVNDPYGEELRTVHALMAQRPAT